MSSHLKQTQYENGNIRYKSNAYLTIQRLQNMQKSQQKSKQNIEQSINNMSETNDFTSQSLDDKIMNMMHKNIKTEINPVQIYVPQTKVYPRINNYQIDKNLGIDEYDPVI